MTGRNAAELHVLLGVSRTHKNFYCFPCQLKIMDLLDRYHGYKISRRTLNRDLGWLEKNGFIKRIRRIRKGECGNPVFTSTLYKFTAKVFKWLDSLGRLVGRCFSWFRVPKMAHYQATQKQASSPVASASEALASLVKKVGSKKGQNSVTGGVCMA